MPRSKPHHPGSIPPIMCDYIRQAFSFCGSQTALCCFCPKMKLQFVVWPCTRRYISVLINVTGGRENCNTHLLFSQIYHHKEQSGDLQLAWLNTGVKSVQHLTYRFNFPATEVKNSSWIQFCGKSSKQPFIWWIIIFVNSFGKCKWGWGLGEDSWWKLMLTGDRTEPLVASSGQFASLQPVDASLSQCRWWRKLEWTPPTPPSHPPPPARCFLDTSVVCTPTQIQLNCML